MAAVHLWAQPDRNDRTCSSNAVKGRVCALFVFKMTLKGKKSEWDNLSKWVLGRGKGSQSKCLIMFGQKKAAGIIHKGACCCRRRRTLAVPEHPLDDPDPTLVCLVTQQHKICTGCFKDIGRFWNFDLKVSGSHKSQGLVKMTLTLQGTKQPDSWTTSARC